MWTESLKRPCHEKYIIYYINVHRTIGEVSQMTTNSLNSEVYLKIYFTGTIYCLHMSGDANNKGMTS